MIDYVIRYTRPSSNARNSQLFTFFFDEVHKDHRKGFRVTDEIKGYWIWVDDKDDISKVDTLIDDIDVANYYFERIYEYLCNEEKTEGWELELLEVVEIE